MSINVTVASLDRAIYFLDPIDNEETSLNSVISSIARAVFRVFNWLFNDGWHDNASARRHLQMYYIGVKLANFTNTPQLEEKAAVLLEELEKRDCAYRLDEMAAIAFNQEVTQPESKFSVGNLSINELSELIGKSLKLITKHDIDVLFEKEHSFKSIDLRHLDKDIFLAIWNKMSGFPHQIENLNISGTFATQAMISHLLPKLKNLKTLDLTGLLINKELLDSIKTNCPHIDRVRVDLKGDISPATILQYSFTKPRFE